MKNPVRVFLISLCIIAGATVAPGPARADDLPPLQRVAELNAPYERCGIGTCTVYLDRSTSKYFADRLDGAGLGSDRVSGVASELMCGLFGKGIGAACGLIDAAFGTSFLEAVQKAEGIDGCVTFKHLRGSDVFATYRVDATNSQYCRD